MYNGYGIQLYSVRDAMSKDVASTLENIAGLGYKYVEFAGFFGLALLACIESYF